MLPSLGTLLNFRSPCMHLGVLSRVRDRILVESSPFSDNSVVGLQVVTN
jgi:hypothetical protein